MQAACLCRGSACDQLIVLIILLFAKHGAFGISGSEKKRMVCLAGGRRRALATAKVGTLARATTVDLCSWLRVRQS